MILEFDLLLMNLLRVGVILGFSGWETFELIFGPYCENPNVKYTRDVKSHTDTKVHINNLI